MNKGISTDDLTIYNSLPSLCKYFPKTPGTKLCIPNERICTPYTVQEGDTCGALQQEFGIRYAQMTSWNPSLGPRCANLKRYVGLVICVSNPGGDWENPSPVPSTTTSTRSVLPGTCLWPFMLPANILQSSPLDAHISFHELIPQCYLPGLD